MVGHHNVYEEVVRIAEDYFGPAAPRIMSRLVTNHLQKAPESLQAKDVPELTKWTCLAMAVVTEDQNIIDQFAERLRQLLSR